MLRKILGLTIVACFVLLGVTAHDQVIINSVATGNADASSLEEVYLTTNSETNHSYVIAADAGIISSIVGLIIFTIYYHKYQKDETTLRQ